MKENEDIPPNGSVLTKVYVCIYISGLTLNMFVGVAWKSTWKVLSDSK